MNSRFPAHGAPLRCGSRDQPHASRLSCSIPAHLRAPQPFALRSHVPPGICPWLGLPQPRQPSPGWGLAAPGSTLRRCGFPGRLWAHSRAPRHGLSASGRPRCLPPAPHRPSGFSLHVLPRAPTVKPNSGGRNKLPSPNRGSAGLTASSRSFCQRSRALHQDLCQQLRPAGTAGRRPARISPSRG